MADRLEAGMREQERGTSDRPDAVRGGRPAPVPASADIAQLPPEGVGEETPRRPRALDPLDRVQQVLAPDDWVVVEHCGDPVLAPAGSGRQTNTTARCPGSM